MTRTCCGRRMTGRLALPVVFTALLGVAVPSALAQVPPVTVPLPPAPPLPVPLPVPVPTVPLQPPPAPPPAPPPPAGPQDAVGGAAGSVGEAVEGVVGGALGVGASAGASSGASGGEAAKPRTRRIKSSKKQIRNTGKRSERTATVITFSLARSAVVRFSIRQEAPNCVAVGSFTVRGHPGVNRVVFRGRYRGVALPPGTYTLTATAQRGRRTIQLGRVRIVIVAPDAEPGSARAQRSTCGPSGDGTSSGQAGAAAGTDDGRSLRAQGKGIAGTASGTLSAGGDTAAESGSAGARVSSGGGRPRDGRILGVLPNPFEDAPGWLRPLLLLALAAAIILLLLAALPASRVRPAGASTLMLHRRTEVAVGGAMILAAVAVLALIL